MKIFRMNDCDFVAAENLDDAKLCLSKMVHDGTVDDVFEREYLDDPQEIAEGEYERLKMVDQDELDEAMSEQEGDAPMAWKDRVMAVNNSAKTFRQALDEMIKEGDEFPCHFASSEH